MNATKRSHRRGSMSLSSLAGSGIIRILVGPERREFLIQRKLLVSSCHFFRQLVETARMGFHNGTSRLTITLYGQCPDMFELFFYWINHGKGFHDFLDDAEANDTCEELHWDLVNLHLFAAQIQLAVLQDLAMDAIQDIYLRCNWDIVPELVKYLYQQCDPRESCRLRKWIVAMTTWVLGGLQKMFMADRIQELFDSCPGFWEEYNTHLVKMSKGKLHCHSKNPQLRLPSNNLRNEERQFGYRQCSFHTHRSAVGQGKCPHSIFPLSPFIPAFATSPSTDGDVGSVCSPASTSASPILSPTTDTIFDLYLTAH